MLLRRFVTNFRRQDWTAILLDFVIVVVGIFVGLQADAWNQDRKDRYREHASLVQLYDEFEQAGQQARDLAGFHGDKTSELQFVVDSILSRSLPGDERRRFTAAVVSMLQLPPLGIKMGTYESMIATGDFALLRDDRLRTMLIELDAQLEAEASLLDYFRAQNMRDFSYVRRYFPVVPNSDGTGTTFEFDFNDVSADPETLTIVATHQRTQQIFGEFRGEIAERFEAARAHIATLMDLQDHSTVRDQAHASSR